MSDHKCVRGREFDTLFEQSRKQGEELAALKERSSDVDDLKKELKETTTEFRSAVDLFKEIIHNQEKRELEEAHIRATIEGDIETLEKGMKTLKDNDTAFKTALEEITMPAKGKAYLIAQAKLLIPLAGTVLGIMVAAKKMGWI